MTRFLQYAAFVVGLAAVCWVGSGYVGTNMLALAITGLVAAFYLMGALELLHFSQATTTLSRAVAVETTEPPASLGQWLAQLHPSLQNAVRLRVEGVRVALPGPAMTPYLAGLLVLLGMLGTFLGMVVTLNGTGIALESAADVQAIRSSLAAPVRGLGVAFGTSVAGVAASAMLGLVSALCRRDRLQAAQLLDTRIATSLRVFSLAHQREESFKLLQRQGEAMPVLVDRLAALMTAMEQQNHALNERLVSSQDSFHSKAEAAYAGLASTVGQSLKDSMTESARAASATIQPVVEATMASIAREAAVLNTAVEGSVQRQLDGLTSTMASIAHEAALLNTAVESSVQRQLVGLTSSFEATTTHVGDIWKSALAGQQHANALQAQDLRNTLGQFAETFEQRSAALVQGVSTQLEGAVSKVSETWGSALEQHQRASEQLSQDTHRLATRFEATTSQVGDIWKSALDGQQQANALQAQDLRSTLDQFAETFEQRSAALVQGVSTQLEGAVSKVSDTWGNALAQHQRVSEQLSEDTHRLASRFEATTAQVGDIWQSALSGQQQANALQAQDLRSTLDQFAETFEQRSAALVQGVSTQLEGAVSKVSDTWGNALAQHQRVSAQLSGDTHQALSAVAASFEQHGAALLSTVDQSHEDLHAKIASRDDERIAAWTQGLESMAASLHAEWQQAGIRSERQQKDISEAFAKTAGDISAQTEANARNTIAEVAQLVKTANEAPRAAAEVIGELRQKLTDSMARDNTMLEERGRILETLETLLGAVNHASNEQRTAIDALVSASADLLDRVGARFNDKVDTETGKMAEVAAQITGSAVEVASLGEAFGLAVQLFGQSNDKLVTHLQRIEGALGKAIARSDEQLDYYVAQAREVIDLSIMSQRQIVEDLQHMATQRSAVGSEA